MLITNSQQLDTYAIISERTYDNNVITPDVSAGSHGIYTEITQIIDGPLGFQARALMLEPK